MSDQYYIDIPLKAHIRKYAEYHLQNSPGNASKKNSVGLLIYLALDKIPPDWKPGKATDSMEVMVWRSMAPIEARGFTIATKKLKLLEDMLDGMLMEELAYYIQLYVQVKSGNKLKAIRSFLLKYNITENEMPLETLKKRIYRAEIARKYPTLL